MTTTTEDFASIVFTVGGFRLTGWAPGTPLTFSPTADQSEMVIGALGHAMFMKLNNLSGTFTADLNPSSQDNAVLNRFFRAQTSIPGGFIFDVVLMEIGSLERLSSECTIANTPVRTWGESSTPRSWSFIGVRWNVQGGGRFPSPKLTIDTLPEEAAIAAVGNFL